MATQAYVVLDAARTHLGDNQAMDWQDNDMFPKLQEAHRELQLKLLRAGIPLQQAVTGDLDVPANTSDLTSIVGYPTDFASPGGVWLFEKYPGQNDNNYIDMQPRSFIPVEAPGTQRLAYWCWQEQKILVRPCTQPVQVKIRYRKFLPVPVYNTDDIGILGGETFLSFRTAALCLEQMEGQESLAAIRNQEALVHLDDVVAVNVNLNQQMLPTRKRGYRRRQQTNFWWGY